MLCLAVNILKRIEEHFTGCGAIYTMKYNPIKVIEVVEDGDVCYGEFEYQEYLQLRQRILEDDEETFMAILDDLIYNS